MENTKNLTRAIRLSQIQHSLHRTPGGLTSHELAKICGVGIRTIQRDLIALQSDLGIPVTLECDRYNILEGYILPPVAFTLNETVALFLITRLVLHQMDKGNPHVQKALTKLCKALPQGLETRFMECVTSFERKPTDEKHIQIFEKAAIAWVTQRRMKIEYQSLKSNKIKKWQFEPYFMEMTGVGYSTYVVGHATSARVDEIRTFKLDRIKEATLLNENFEIPEEFSIDKLLKSSWGIFRGEENEVKLRFSPAVTRRVKESIWHPSQTIEDLPDSGCLLTVKVGNTLEMTPWIRGWGPDVEVIEPLSLKEQFRDWSESLYRLYHE